MRLKNLLKMEIKRNILNYRFAVILILILAVMFLCMSNNPLTIMRNNAPRHFFSSIKELYSVLVFDRFKPIMVLLLTLISTVSTSDDLESGYARYAMSRCGVGEYVLAKLIMNALGISAACILSFLLFLFLLLPVMPFRDFHFTPVSGFELTTGSPLPFLYAVTEGFLFSLYINFLSTVSVLISILHANRYVAAAVPFILFYVLYAVTSMMPLYMNVWYLSSGVVVLPVETGSIVKYLYACTFFAIPAIILSGLCIALMYRRKRYAEL